MDFNDMLTEIGGYGRYQRFMLWFVLFPTQLPYLCQVYSHLFMSITPDHWCRVSLLESWNVTDHFNRHLFVPKKDNVLHSLQYEQCFVYNISYQTLIAHSQQIGWIPNQTWPITKCSQGWVYNRTLLGEDNSIITKWDLVCDQTFQQTIPVMLFFLGSFFGLIFANCLSHKFGKKCTYFLMLLLQCLLGAGTAFATQFELFCVMRFGVGFSIPSIASIPRSVALELTPVQKTSNVLLESELWRNFGALLLVLVSYLIRDFRHLTVALSVPFLVFLLYLCLFPESPKWLIVNEKIEKLDKLVKYIASTNVRFLSPDYGISLRRRIRIECALQTELRAKQSNCLLIKLLFLPNLRTKAITLCLLYITHSITDIGFTYYVIHFSENRGNGDIYFPFLVAIISNLLGLFIARITLNRFGRKYTVSFGDILSAFFSLMSAFVKNKDINLCLIYFASAKVFQSSSLYCLLVWSHELIGVSHFNSLINLFETFTHLALVSVPLIIYYTNKMALNIANGITLSLCLSVFSSLLLISAFLAFTLPDTNNHTVYKNGTKTDDIPKHSNKREGLNPTNQMGKPKNGILKNKGPQPQSPIISLLRRQEMIRQNQNDFEYTDRITESEDNPREICTIKVTVL